MRAKLDSPRMASGRQIATCLILVLVALPVAACGKDSPQGPKIPADTAALLDQKLDRVQSRLTPGKDCGDEDTAQTSLDGAQDFVDQIPEGDVDPGIIDDLRELLGDYDQKLAAECAAGGLAATEDTETEPTESTEPEAPDDTTKDKPERSTTTTESTETTTTTSTATEPATPTPPDETPGGQPGEGGPPAGGPAAGGPSQGGFEAGGTAPGGRAAAGGGR